jgi:hypothetical protein
MKTWIIGVASKQRQARRRQPQFRRRLAQIALREQNTLPPQSQVGRIVVPIKIKRLSESERMGYACKDSSARRSVNLRIALTSSGLLAIPINLN